MISTDIAAVEELLKIGDYEAACAAFKEVVAREPMNTKALMGLGKAYARLDQPLEALEVFTKVLTLEPGNPEAHYGASWAHWRRKDWRKARLFIEQALALAPDVAEYHLMAAECARKLRDSESLLRHLNMAVRLEPDVLGRRTRWVLAYYRVFSGIEGTALLWGWGFLAALWSCGFMGATRYWWLLLASLPFIGVSTWHFKKRRYRRAVWALVVWGVWVALTYLLLRWLLNR
ncbi:MAG: tetratricopeptide repeat protein [Anaerolineae bacterium]|jgi:tetratricopeptide (TPR) repeat protein|uniref:tetratricopeptide repeat protein n=1 Tax=Thermogutta sp. TaxID=1962930 RepID=UPI00321F76C9